MVTMKANDKSPHQTAGRQFHKNGDMSSKMSSPKESLGRAVGCKSEPCTSFGLHLLCLRRTTFHRNRLQGVVLDPVVCFKQADLSMNLYQPRPEEQGVGSRGSCCNAERKAILVRVSITMETP